VQYPQQMDEGVPPNAKLKFMQEIDDIQQE
jgi:hypothetical protein